MALENEETHRLAINHLRAAKNQLMVDSAATPLNSDQLQRFKGLDYFPVEYKNRLEGRFSTEGAGKEVTLKTTDGKTQVLITAGTVTFQFDGKTFTLTVFRNNNLPEFVSTNQKLFIPFTDLTNGKETNDQGRYLPVDDPGTGTQMVVDLNLAMNPYNGYNGRFPAVLAPPVNNLPVNLQTGERKFEDRLR